MDSAWKEVAQTWNEDSTVAEFSADALKAVETHLVPHLKKPLSECAVLDIGCGTGHLARRMAPQVKQIVAVDPEPDMIANFKPVPANVELVCGVIDDVMTRQFDLIVASSVCSFVPDYAHMLRSVSKLGALFMQLDMFNENGIADNRADGFSEQMIRTATTDAGLEVLYVGCPFKLYDTCVIGAVVQGPGH